MPRQGVASPAFIIMGDPASTEGTVGSARAGTLLGEGASIHIFESNSGKDTLPAITIVI